MQNTKRKTRKVWNCTNINFLTRELLSFRPLQQNIWDDLYIIQQVDFCSQFYWLQSKRREYSFGPLIHCEVPGQIPCPMIKTEWILQISPGLPNSPKFLHILSSSKKTKQTKHKQKQKNPEEQGFKIWAFEEDPKFPYDSVHTLILKYLLVSAN